MCINIAEWDFFPIISASFRLFYRFFRLPLSRYLSTLHDLTTSSKKKAGWLADQLHLLFSHQFNITLMDMLLNPPARTSASSEK